MKVRKCKKCWWPIDHSNTLISRCKKCTYKNSENNPKQTRIKVKSTKNKNNIAKFSKKTKWQILVRDKSCIFCNKPITDIHHIYFWTECNFWDNRNDITQGVWVCRSCHDEIHSCSKWEWKRQEAINYLKNLHFEEVLINTQDVIKRLAKK
jgi:hypothetical protein